MPFDTPSRPKPWTSPARRSVCTSPRRVRARRPRSAASSATAREWPSVYGDLRSTKLAIASSAASNCSSDSTTVSAGSASMTADHVSTRVEAAEDRRRRRRRGRPTSAGSNWVPARRRATLRAASTPLEPIAPPRRTRPAARSARRSGTSSPRPAPRASPCRPTARRRAERIAAPESTARAPRRACGPAWRAGRSCLHVVSAVHRELDAGSHPVQRASLPAPKRRSMADRLAEALGLVVVLRRLEVDVVAEPLRLLVGVGVTADVDQQRRVVDARPFARRRGRRGRPPGWRSGTGAARAPSAARSRDRSRATTPRRARPSAPAIVAALDGAGHPCPEASDVLPPRAGEGAEPAGDSSTSRLTMGGSGGKVHQPNG